MNSFSIITQQLFFKLRYMYGNWKLSIIVSFKTIENSFVKKDISVTRSNFLCIWESIFNILFVQSHSYDNFWNKLKLHFVSRNLVFAIFTKLKLYSIFCTQSCVSFDGYSDLEQEIEFHFIFNPTLICLWSLTNESFSAKGIKIKIKISIIVQRIEGCWYVKA